MDFDFTPDQQALREAIVRIVDDNRDLPRSGGVVEPRACHPATAMEQAFMQGGEYATARALSAGMWQALLASVGSLLVAIPAHLCYHFLSGRVRAIVRDVEWSANEAMRYLLTDYRGKGPSDDTPPSSP